MSSVPISADPSAVVRAFEEIRNAIRRAGQEGRAFSDLDLSHPELKELGDDIKALHGQWEMMRRLPGSAVSQRMRATQQEGRAPWDLDFSRMYTDPSQARRSTQQLGRYILENTRWASQQGGGGGGIPPVDTGLQRFGGILPGGVPGAIKLALGALGIGGIASMVSGGVKDAQQIAMGSDDFLRRMEDSTEEFDSLRDKVRSVGDRFGILSTESVRLAAAYARASGIAESVAATRGADVAVGFGRGFGMEPASSVEGFGRMSLMTGMGPQRIAMIFAEAISRGGMFARGEEVMKSIEGYVARVSDQTLRAPDVTAAAALRAELYKMGQEGRPALLGAAGDRIMAALEQAMVNPGMGEAGQFFMLRALGGNLDPAQARYLREGGLFEKAGRIFPGESMQTNLERVLDQLTQEGKGLPNQYWLMEGLANLTGLSMHQAEALLDVRGRLGNQGFGAMSRLLEGTGTDLSSINASGLHDLATITSADRSGLLAMARRYAEREDVTADQRKALAGADTLSDDALRKELASIAASLGMIPNDGTKVRQSISELQRVIEKEVGEKLLPVATDIRFFTARISEAVAGALTSGETPTEMERMERLYPSGRSENRGVGGAVEEMRESLTPGRGEEMERMDRLKPLSSVDQQVLRELMISHEQRQGLPSGSLYAQMLAESGGDPNAVSPRGALGLMQIMPDTARVPGFGVKPLQNWGIGEQVRFAADYMKAMLDRYGSMRTAWAAYNAGPRTVDDYGGIPPWRKTRDYVDRIDRERPRQAALNEQTLNIVIQQRDSAGRDAGPPQRTSVMIGAPGGAGKVTVDAGNAG